MAHIVSWCYWWWQAILNDTSRQSQKPTGSWPSPSSSVTVPCDHHLIPSNKSSSLSSLIGPADTILASDWLIIRGQLWAVSSCHGSVHHNSNSSTAAAAGEPVCCGDVAGPGHLISSKDWTSIMIGASCRASGTSAGIFVIAPKNCYPWNESWAGLQTAWSPSSHELLRFQVWTCWCWKISHP